MIQDGFLEETLKILTANKKTTEDVEYVMVRSGGSWDDKSVRQFFSWEDFERVADFEYDSGSGGAEIHQSLKVVGDNWWLERGEYDGSEWWEFKTMPIKPEISIIPEKKDLLDD